MNCPTNPKASGKDKKRAAHIDNLLHHWLQLDSPTDQQAIINGYNYHMIR